MRTGHRFNMFIMRRDLLDAYCEWLFDILFELENRLAQRYKNGNKLEEHQLEENDNKGNNDNKEIYVDEAQISDGQSRLYGYIGERLLDVWIDANGFEYAELPYVFIGNEHMIRKGAAMMLRKLKSKLAKTAAAGNEYEEE